MNQAINGAEKLVYITLGVIFLLLGVVGLLIPIIPGILFLVGAVYLLSRGSDRVKRYADSQPTWQKMQRRVEQFDAVSAAEKAQVAGLMMVKTAAVGTRKVIVGVKRLIS